MPRLSEPKKRKKKRKNSKTDADGVKRSRNRIVYPHKMDVSENGDVEIIRVGRHIVRKEPLKDEDLSTWTDEELRRGARLGVERPHLIPRDIYLEFVARVQSSVRQRMARELKMAVKVHVKIIKSWDDDPDSVPAAVVLKAIDMLYDRVLGKTPDTVAVYGGGPAPWEKLVGTAIIPSQDLLEEYEHEAARQLQAENEAREER
jgi:hypothetical protein